MVWVIAPEDRTLTIWAIRPTCKRPANHMVEVIAGAMTWKPAMMKGVPLKRSVSFHGRPLRPHHDALPTDPAVVQPTAPTAVRQFG
jgi:hypothetical protein